MPEGQRAKNPPGAAAAKREAKTVLEVSLYRFRGPVQHGGDSQSLSPGSG